MAKRRTKKICNKCGVENALNAKKCKSCSSEKFAPAWIEAKRPITPNISIEVTRQDPKFGKPEPRITLSKWWPGGRHTYHIPNPSLWEEIETIINNDLAPLIGWKPKSKLINAIAEKKSSKPKDQPEYKELIESHPDVLKKLVASIDPSQLSQKDFDRVIEIFGDISDALTNASAGFRDAFLGVVKKLPKQKQRALEDLELLLEGWSLHLVTNVAQQVRARIDTIELFEKQIQDPKTFEIFGDNSIHRIIERSMWMIDERYWLLQSNRSLRNFIGEEMSKRDKKKFGKKRPDFACGTVGNKLIILELKRPEHALCVDDLNQLETYTVIAEDYKNFSSYEGYLVGSKKDGELERYLKRRSGFKVLFFSDIVESTRQRYSEFLKTIENEKEK